MSSAIPSETARDSALQARRLSSLDMKEKDKVAFAIWTQPQDSHFSRTLPFSIFRAKASPAIVVQMFLKIEFIKFTVHSSFFPRIHMPSHVFIVA